MSAAAAASSERVRARRLVAYVSNAASHDISVLQLDPDRGTLHEVQRVAAGGLAMPLALSPNRTRLYAGRRSAPFAVLGFEIGADGRLGPLGEAPLPASMASIATDRSGRFLFGASYDGHQVSVNPIDAEGRVGPTLQVLPTGANAHAIQADPGNRFVFATSLGTDTVHRFDFDQDSGALTPHADSGFRIEAGERGRAGARHLAFHPNGRLLFVLNELDASVAVFGYDAGSGGVAPLQRIGTLPPGFDAEPWAAEIRITPDGRHLYTSERRASTLAGFRIDPTSGELAPIGHWPAETQPRGFAIDPSGRWLVCAGQRSDRVASYAIDPDSGALAWRAAASVGREPNWVEIVALA